MNDWLDLLKLLGFQIAPSTEADNTLLDVQRIHLLLDDALREVCEEKLALIDLLPALIGLQAIEKSPFTTKITDFMKMYFGALDNVQQSHLIQTMANTGTRDAAHLLLDLHLVVPDKWQEVLDGLVLIGGTAIEEALQRNRSGELSDAKLRELLLRSYAPEATRALWERYGLEPGGETNEIRVAWAESWACRLTLAENDRLMRTIPYNGPIDFEIWPYRKSQHSALAAIVQKCVQILQSVYENKQYGDTKQQQEEFVDSIEHIAQFDLRVQIPLLVRLKVSKISVKDSRDNKRIEAVLPDKHHLEKHAWYALMTARGRRNDKNFWSRVGGGVGVAGQFGGCVLLWAGIVALLWNVLPNWLLIGIIALLVATSICAIICAFLALKRYNPDIPKYTCIQSIIVLLALLFMMGYLFFWAQQGQEVAVRFMATRKMKLWYPITSLIMVAVCAVLGGFALQKWFHLVLPMSILIVGFGCLLCTVLQGWASASLVGSMLPWLEKHPHGQVVLDEFRE